jgi:hypothetical protein
MKFKTFTVAVIVMSAVLVASSVRATVISPLNGSFESPTFTSAYYVACPTDWSPIGDGSGQLLQRESYYYPIAAEGFTWLGLEDNNGSHTGVQQDLGTMTTGEKYTFGAILASHNDGYNCQYKISFFDVTDNRELASITQADFDPSGGVKALGQTMPASFSYIATAADNNDVLRLVLESTASSGQARTGVDLVAVTTTQTPEPGTIALLIGGLASLAAYAWRRRK